MGVNYAHLRNLTAREIISALIRDGFSYDRGAGSHQIYYHPDGRRVTVTFPAPGDTFARRH
jgi:predicted RNA binding protein YcfA (HicA-like mRNA interferase family)